MNEAGGVLSTITVELVSVGVLAGSYAFTAGCRLVGRQRAHVQPTFRPFGHRSVTTVNRH
jgi:hypothetical protein